MTTAHTPGPWRPEEEVIIERTGRIHGIYVAFFDTQEDRFDGRICQAFANCLVTSDAAVRANAKLIAAAPELLAALRSQWCVDCKQLIANPKKWDEPCSCDAARAAITKAGS